MNALDAICEAEKRQQDGRKPPPHIHFVSPVLSAMLAASTVHNTDLMKETQFSADCRGYAENNGLIAALSGQYKFPERRGRQGQTYTKLTRLATADEVENCNAIIIDCNYSAAIGMALWTIFQ